MSDGSGLGRHRPWGKPLVIAGLVATVLLPALLIAHPPLQDYPNHLARLHILSHPDDAVLSRFYRPDWTLRPNLGFDLIALPLAWMMPAEAAGRIVLILSIALFVTAPIALERALRGEVRGGSLLAMPLVFNLVLQKGFLGYFLGIGLAVWAYAFWVGAAGRPVRRALVAHLGAALIFVAHLYAFGVFAILVGGHWLGEWIAGRRDRRWQIEGGLSASGFVLPAILFVATPTAEAVSVTAYAPVAIKLTGLVSSLVPVATLPALMIVALAFVPAAARVLRRQPMLGAPVLVPVLILALLALALPYRLMSSANADWRIVPPLALVVLGASDLGLPRRAAEQAIVALGAVLALVASFSTVALWSPGDPVAESFERVTAGLEPGTRLFPVILDPLPWGPGVLSYQHIAARAVMRGVFVPSVFAIPSQQPLRLTPEVESLRLPLGQVFYGETVPDWQEVAGNFDCVLLIHTDPASLGTAPALPIDAAPVRHEPQFLLYRIAGAASCRRRYRQAAVGAPGARASRPRRRRRRKGWGPAPSPPSVSSG